MSILKDLTCTLTSMYSDIVADPPDPNYTTVVDAPLSQYDAMPETERDELADAIDRQRAYGRAALQSYEKYLGALGDAEDEFVSLQADAVDDFTTNQIQSMEDTAAALRSYADLLDTDPDAAGPVMTAEERAALVDIYTCVHTSGFTDDEIDQLHDLGYTDDDIALIRTHFDIDSADIPQPGQTIQDMLRSFANELEEGLPAFDAFARNAAAIAGRTFVPPGNHDPVANDDSANTTSGNGVQIDVLGNDTDEDGDTLTITNFTQGATGTVNCSATDCTYTAGAGTGTETFEYTISDGNGGSATAQVEVTVTEAPTTGSITVTVQAVPRARQDFSFTTTGDGWSPFALDDDTNPTLPDTTTFSGLAPGVYTITEDPMPGWTLGLGCTGNSQVVSGQPRTISINLAAGDGVQCNFNNVRPEPLEVKSAGPLDTIYLGNVLNCQVDHVSDTQHEFFGGDLGACATELATDGTLYGPNGIPAGNSPGGLIFVSQSGVTGDGSPGNPLTVVTVVDAGETGLRITQTDSYVVGAESYRTDVEVSNLAGAAQEFILYRGGDCYLQNSDAGFGDLDLATGVVGCRGSSDSGQTPNDRIEHWIPLTPGSSALEAHYQTVWGQMSLRNLFANTCQCGQFLDNGAGLSWAGEVGAGGSSTYSHLTLFSPNGVGSSFVTKSAELATVTAGGQDAYTITIHNPTGTALSVTSITDHLPDGFDYVAGSTSGLTTSEPDVDGQDLTWNGSFEVPALGMATLTFDVVVSGTPGTYTNSAEAIGDAPIAPAEDTAPVTVDPPGSITIVKDSAPADAQDFEFSFTGKPNFFLDDDTDPTRSDTKVFAGLTAGDYTVAEILGTPHWVLTGLECDGNASIDHSNGSAVVHLAAGQDVTCTYTNTKLGSITVVKDSVPDHAQDFQFLGSGNGVAASFDLDDDDDATLPDTRTFSDLEPGPYSVIEVAATNWPLTALECSAGGSGEVDTGTATITLVAGAHMTCTFTNTKVTTPPVPNDDSFNTERRGDFYVLANDSDPEGDHFEITGTTQPAHGTVTCDPRGACTFLWDPGDDTSDSFQYTVEDTDGLTGTATVSVNRVFAGVFTVPVAVTDQLATRAGEAKSINLLANDVSPNGDPLDLLDWSDPSHGAVECDVTGLCTYTPVPGFTGFDGFTYTMGITGGGPTATGQVLITVVAANAAPAVSIEGAPPMVVQGDDADWIVALMSSPDALPTDWFLHQLPLQLDVTLAGPHAFDPASLLLAPGWSSQVLANGVTLLPGANALLGESTVDALPTPLPPISQGTGGDGHVPILVGSKVYAFFHHQFPTKVSCVDRATGQVCPGYPHQLQVGAGDIIGPAAIVGTQLWVHAYAATNHSQLRPVTLFCWDTATAEPCGIVVLDEENLVNGGSGAVESAPVLVGGKVYVAADTGKLYCYDPALDAPCALPSAPTGLDNESSGFDILTHAGRIWVSSRMTLDVACIVAATGAPCTGWDAPRTFGGWNLITEHNAAGAVVGMCAASPTSLECVKDAAPATVVDHPAWNFPNLDDYYDVPQEAETGTRTLMGSLYFPGLVCWDWATLAPCAGGDFADGHIAADVNDLTLPSVYGAAWDGSCVVGLGDPGQVFTVDPAGFSPCSSLGTGTQGRVVDLRDQRCDATVGNAAWLEVRIGATDLTPGTEFDAFVVVVRDAESGEVLAEQDMVGTNGVLDLSGIDPVAHPAVALDTLVQSAFGGPAWADGNPPRIQLVWDADPAQGCFQSNTAVDCALTSPTPISATVASVPSGLLDTDSLSLVPPEGDECTEPPENRPPSANGQSVSTPEDTAKAVTLSGSDPDGDSLTFSIVSGPSHGQLSGSGASRTYTPDANYHGPDSFTFKVNDGTVDSSAATVNIDVTPLNDRTGRRMAQSVSTPEDTAKAITLAGSDIDGDGLTFSIVSGPSHGGLTGSGSSADVYAGRQLQRRGLVHVQGERRSRWTRRRRR